MNKLMENNKIEIRSIEIIGKGVLLALISTIILLIIFSAILTYTGIPESLSSTAIIILSAISILIASQITARKIKKNGILNGGLIGAIYIIIIYLISSIISGNFALGLKAVIMIVASIIAGMLGGIIGVNMK